MKKMMDIYVDVRHKTTIDFRQMADITMETLRHVYDIPKDAFVEEDELKVWHNTHGSGTTESIRPATSCDRQIVEVISEIDAHKRRSSD